MANVKRPSSKFIQEMFDGLAQRYDLFNHLTSAGLAVLWRKEVLKSLQPGMRVLDLGCGTGDLTLGAIKKVRPSGEVTGLDFSKNMLQVAKRRMDKWGLNGDSPVHFICDRAEALPIETEPYDAVISGFVLRNLT